VCLGFLFLLSGCASRPSVQRLYGEIAALQARVEEINRSLAQTVSMTKEAEGRLGERIRGVPLTVDETRTVTRRVRGFS